MTGILTLPAGTSPRSPPNNRQSLAISPRSVSQMSFRGRIHCKSATGAFAETALAVNKRRSGSLYDVLRVKSNASPADIKKAYRSLAKIYHPDATSAGDSSDGRDFMQIHNAYATLSDPMAKAMCDMSLSMGSMTRQYGRRSGFYPTRRWESDQCW